MSKHFLALTLSITCSLTAQQPQLSRPLAPEDKPDIRSLSRTVLALRGTAQLNGDTAAKADKLLKESESLLAIGQTGEARRRLANAQALVTGKPWTAGEEFVWSLVLRQRPIVIDSSLPAAAELTQLYSAPYQPAAGLKLRLGISTSGAESKPVRELTTVDIPVRDLVSEPLLIPLAVAGTPDGSYRLAAQLLDGSDALLSLQQPIALAEGIATRLADTERRLARSPGHESAKATVRWPFDMARVVNTGIRRLETTDFGLPESGGQVFDFSKELRESAELLKALEAGKDPLVRAKGDHERHYLFEETGEIMPYRVYVPSTWDGRKQLPMIFVLHGNTRDHNFYFDRDGGLLAKLAEKNGYIVATTMGYRPNAGYNAGAIGSLLAGSNAPAATRGDGELSEKDAMKALDLVVKEYNPSRVYLFGHSAGGTGGWYLASKYTDRFAGVAFSAFGTQPASVPFEKLKGMPVLVIIGSKDTPRAVENARNMAKVVADNGFTTKFLELPEATHDTIVGLSLPTVFEFFTAHRKK